MVWGALSKIAKLPLVFVDSGVKINAKFCKTEILESQLKVWADATHGFGNWRFQQDSAPAHMAKLTQEWCKDECPDFISTSEWPPSSPDLNPLDYSVWGVLEARVNAMIHRSLNSLKQKLIKEWDRLSMDYVRATIDALPKRLRAVVKAKGGRFE
jgi:inhibitor of nuclear factor kappa-B kinase subunit alpha